MRDSLSALDEYPGESIATRQTTPIDRLQRNIACWFPHDYSQVASTSGTTSGEVSGHAVRLTLPVRAFNVRAACQSSRCSKTSNIMGSSRSGGGQTLHPAARLRASKGLLN